MENKLKIVYIILGVLVLLNLGLLAFIWKGKGHPMQHKTPRDIITQQLNFDENQQKKYTLLIDQHRQSIDEQASIIRTSKQLLYQSISSNNITYQDSLLSVINQAQLSIERLHLNHFSDIKLLCRPDQNESFKKLSHELGRIFQPKPNRPRK